MLGEKTTAFYISPFLKKSSCQEFCCIVWIINQLCALLEHARCCDILPRSTMWCFCCWIRDLTLFQDPAVWKLLCALAWPTCRRSDLARYGGAWRNMFIHRPRVRTDGMYALK